MKLTVPTDLSEITLGQLQTLNDIEEAELDAIDRQIDANAEEVRKKIEKMVRKRTLQHLTCSSNVVTCL